MHGWEGHAGRGKGGFLEVVDGVRFSTCKGTSQGSSDHPPTCARIVLCVRSHYFAGHTVFPGLWLVSRPHFSSSPALREQKCCLCLLCALGIWPRVWPRISVNLVWMKLLMRGGKNWKRHLRMSWELTGVVCRGLGGAECPWGVQVTKARSWRALNAKER